MTVPVPVSAGTVAIWVKPPVPMARWTTNPVSVVALSVHCSWALRPVSRVAVSPVGAAGGGTTSTLAVLDQAEAPLRFTACTR